MQKQESTTAMKAVFIEPLLTRRDLAGLLKISNRTIGRLLETGELPTPLLVGQSYRWRPKDIETYIGGHVANN